MRQKYYKINNKWYHEDHCDEIYHNNPNTNHAYWTDKEAMLLKLSEITKILLLQRNNRKKLPIAMIIDGVDGAGKTTLVENIIEELKKYDLKVIFNTFKRRRNDDKRFKNPTIQYEWMFRKEVVEQINRRLVEYTDEDIIIVDKSPYCEYFYQKTSSFDRGTITPHGNFKMEIEIFKYKDIIDNAVKIFVENDSCWDNYYKRETKKSNSGHQASYNTLNKEQYMEMVRMFKKYQTIYEDKKKYKAVKILNDSNSWKRVYNEIIKIMKNGS